MQIKERPPPFFIPTCRPINDHQEVFKSVHRIPSQDDVLNLTITLAFEHDCNSHGFVVRKTSSGAHRTKKGGKSHGRAELY